MKYNLIFFVILSVSLVYGGVSFRKPRSPQWQPAPTFNGTAAGYQPNPSDAFARRHPVPSYNRTRPLTTRYPTRYVHQLPNNRFPAIVNVTGRTGPYQPTYNQTRPTVIRSRQPPLGRHWNATIMATNSRLYPNISDRFGGAAPSQPAHPYNPYFPTNSGPSNPNFNTTRTNLPTFYPTGRYNRTGQPPVTGPSTWGQPQNSNTYASGQQPVFGNNPNPGGNASVPTFYFS